MVFFFSSKHHYVPVAERLYHDEESKTGEGETEPRGATVILPYGKASQTRMGPWAWVLIICALTGVGATWTLAVMKLYKPSCSNQVTVDGGFGKSLTCARPAIRREWRTLSRADRNEYIAAVQCLSTKPSKLYSNGSLYDDFPRVHQATAPTAHKAAPFLPWHRYFVHAYESTLKNECGFSGLIP